METGSLTKSSAVCEFKEENLGLADAMAKILKPCLKRKSPILARSRGTERKIDNSLKEENVCAVKKIKKDDPGYVLPSVVTKDFDRGLQKTATQGVIALFNAVRTQQKSLQVALSKASGFEEKKVTKKIMDKNQFLKSLKTFRLAKPNSESTTNQKTLLTEDSCPGHKADWLKADFLLKSKLNWDQKEESEPELLQDSSDSDSRS
ncbi:RRP15-like protein [Zophobas morio]|uniref:RRP15-like protein n=1 Tax=Zophobas morio TaxID=2755281 RepID=UPI003083305D